MQLGHYFSSNLGRFFIPIFFHLNKEQMQNFTFSTQLKRIVFFLSIILLSTVGTLYSQTTVDVLVPSGGFEIDGDLEEGTYGFDPGGDWLIGTPPNGYGYIFDASGPIDTNTTHIVSDNWGNGGNDNIFTSGSKAFMNPNQWKWAYGNATGKGDVNNMAYHLTEDAIGDEWIIFFGDRRTTNGTSYIDFEFYQETLTADPNFGFTTGGPDGGRTVNDILLTIEYTSGGSLATVDFYWWQSDGNGGFEYLLVPTSISEAPSIPNGAVVNLPSPYMAFGDTSYDPLQFVEGAVNLSDIFDQTIPCVGVSFKTLLVKTKNCILNSSTQ